MESEISPETVRWPTHERPTGSLVDPESSQPARNLIDVDALSNRDVDRIFRRACALREASTPLGNMTVQTLRGHIAAMLFFEPSTRTRLSFELAAQRLGAAAIPLEVSRSSIEKGEALHDTLETLVALGVTIAILRHPDSNVYDRLCGRLGISLLNAGHGVMAHPTQALLDAFTLEQRLGSLAGRRIVLCGDVLHSRVARSNLRMLSRLGAEIVLCGPSYFMPSPADLPTTVKVQMAPLDDVVDSADAIMCLRIQRERHAKATEAAGTDIDYLSEYGLTEERFARTRPHCVLLHPGPVNRGMELAAELVEHPRSLILEQVRNGLYIRMAVLEWLARVLK